MKVIRKSLISGAEEAIGVAVVIDVLRAFTCTALMFHYGLEKLFLVETPEEALLFREQNPGCLVAGEVKGVKPPDFDIGNSPVEIIQAGEGLFKGKIVVLRSSAGTQGVIAASKNSKQVILGSYVTANAIAKYISEYIGQEQTVTLVGMGLEAKSQSVEDEACGDYIQHLLDGSQYNHLNAIWASITDSFIAKSLRGDRPHMPREDVIVALQRDLFNFVMVADGQKDTYSISVNKINV